MTLIDSAATFEKRCNDIDDTGGLLNGLKDQDIKCFSALAFTIGTPQVAPTDLNMRTWPQRFSEGRQP